MIQKYGFAVLYSFGVGSRLDARLALPDVDLLVVVDATDLLIEGVAVRLQRSASSRSTEYG